MRSLPGFDDEARRLAALHSLDLLDTEPEAEFDALVALAAQLLDSPTALLTLVDRDRQWIKACEGGTFEQTCRADAFCDYTIRGDEPMVVEDAALDPRFSANPLVIGPDAFRFYAGAPIYAPDPAGVRRAIGAVCVLDQRPKLLSEEESTALLNLARIAEALIGARAAGRRALAVAAESERQAAAIARRDRTLRQAERIAQIGSWRYLIAEDRVDWSAGAYRVHGLDGSQPLSVTAALDHYPPDARARVGAKLVATIETGVPFDSEEDIVTARGERRRMHVMAELECVDGRPYALVGVLQDVTQRHKLEMELRRSADTDALTGLSNRAAFDRLIGTALKRYRDHATPLLLAMIDLDGFKAINDTLGHLAGDDVLRQVGRVLRAPWLAGSAAARLGGDEFAVLIEDPGLLATPELLRARLEEALRWPIATGGLAMTAAGTVGLATPHMDDVGVRDLFRRADTNLYAAKRARVGRRAPARQAG